MQIALSTSPAPGWRQKRLDHEWRFAALKVRIAASRCLKHFHPNQPRVPAGNPDGGQWTDTGASHENATSGDMPVQLVQSRPPRFGTRINIGGRLLEATPAQAARYDVLHAQAASALRQVRAIDPNWRPAPSLTSGSIEGEIARLEGELRETEAHLRRITPLDFNGYNHYARFGRELHNATRRAGYDDVELYMRGSSVTGRSFSKGTPFRSKSDYDVAIVSPTMMRRAEAVGVEIHKTGGRTRWALTPDQEAALGLSGLSRALTQRSGHPTSVMIYRSQTVLDDRNSQDREVMRNRHGDAFAKEYRSYRRIPIE